MKKNLFMTAMVVALVLCLSFGAFAGSITNPDTTDPNQYEVTQALQDFETTKDLFIGTMDKWIEAGGAVDVKANGDKTFFQNGEAIHENDIILTNGKVGIVLAVGTRNPWGYPSGSVLDAGVVTKDAADSAAKTEAKRDTVWSIEFLMNNWDGWSPNNCGTVKFDLVDYNFTKKIAETGADSIKAVEVSRVFNIDGYNFEVVTYYGIAPNANYAYMFDSVTNKGEATEVLLNNFCITNKGDDGGSMITIDSSTAAGSYGNKAGQEYSTFLALPDKNTSSTGTERKFSGMGGSLGYKELHADYTYAKDESVTYSEYIVMSDKPTTAALDSFLNTHSAVDAKTISGVVKDGGAKAVPNAVVVAKKDDKIYGWVMADKDGNYSMDLPDGNYKLSAEKDGLAKGDDLEIKVVANDNTKDLTSGKAKVKVTFNLKDQDGNPVWGKIELFDKDKKSVYPTVRFTGDSVYQANEKGKIEAMVAPGSYVAAVFGEGYWFYSNPKEITADTKDAVQDVTITMKYGLADGWLSADMHHHANKNDAFADPADAIPSIAASGLDVAFITDHDFTVNNKKAYDLAPKYGLTGFIPSEEISASWAHFNVVPQNKESYDYFLDEKAENHVMNQFADLPVFVKETHDKDATITANHPWSSYGLFKNAATAPGGFVDDYDNIEINADRSNGETYDTIISAVDNWNAFNNGGQYKGVDVKKAHYIVGGSDTHDVRISGFSTGADKAYGNSANDDTKYATGKVRTVANVGNTNDSIVDNGLAFANAIAKGNSYVTFGPLLDFNKMPGKTYKVDRNFSWNVDIQSLTGIDDVIVLSSNGKDEYKDFPPSKRQKQLIKYDASLSETDLKGVNEYRFTLFDDKAFSSEEARWYAVMVVDTEGKVAVSNPVWAEQDTIFNDITAWYVPYVNALADLGIIAGYGDGTFKPEANVTRAEFAQMIAKVAPAAKETKKVTFPDVKEGAWYYDSVMYMAENGYIVGYNGKFNPDAKITRAEIAQMIYAMSGFEATDKTFFKDVPAKAWYATAVNTLADKKYIAGYEDKTFRPDNSATRAESARFVYTVVFKK